MQYLLGNKVLLRRFRGRSRVGHTGTQGTRVDRTDKAFPASAGRYRTALKATEGWSNNGSGTDLFGFSAMPGGSRFYSDGSFFSGGDYGLWWTSSPIESDLFHRSLWNQEQGILQFSVPLEVGAAVRCLQD